MIRRKTELGGRVPSKNGGRGILLIFQAIENRGSDSIATDVDSRPAAAQKLIHD